MRDNAKRLGPAVGLGWLLAAGGLASGGLQDEPGRFEKGLCGRIVAADPAAEPPTLTIHLEEFDTRLSLDVAPGAEVRVAYGRGTLRDVAAGRLASLRLGPDHRVVSAIHLGGPIREVEIRSVEPDGALTVVDADDDEDAPALPRQVRLAEDAILRIGGLAATRRDLLPGLRVPLEFADDGSTVNAIEAEADPALIWHGEILRVDPAGRAILVRSEDEDDRPVDLVLGVPGDAPILLDGRPVSLLQLRPGCEVMLRTDPGGRSARSIRAAAPERDEPVPPLLAGER